MRERGSERGDKKKRGDGGVEVVKLAGHKKYNYTMAS